MTMAHTYQTKRAHDSYQQSVIADTRSFAADYDICITSQSVTSLIYTFTPRYWLPDNRHQYEAIADQRSETVFVRVLDSRERIVVRCSAIVYKDRSSKWLQLNLLDTQRMLHREYRCQ